MNTPGFTAEAALYKTNQIYLANGTFVSEAAVKPASKGFPCSSARHLRRRQRHLRAVVCLRVSRRNALRRP